MEIFIHHQMRILNKVAIAMKFHLEGSDNHPVVIVSGLINNSDVIINQEELSEDEIADLLFESIIYHNTEDIEICLKNFRSKTIEDIVSVFLIKDKEITADKRFPLTKLNAKINVAGLEFEV